jgi:hypothetical protein
MAGHHCDGPLEAGTRQFQAANNQGETTSRPIQGTQTARAPLSWAAKGEHKAAVTLLIGRDDVDVDKKDKYDRTP